MIDLLKEIGMAIAWLLLGYLLGERSSGKGDPDDQ